MMISGERRFYQQEGVEKIDIAREYGNQSEITATDWDKILPASAIQIIYSWSKIVADTFYAVPPVSFNVDAIRFVDSRHEQKNRTILGQTARRKGQFRKAKLIFARVNLSSTIEHSIYLYNIGI